MIQQHAAPLVSVFLALGVVINVVLLYFFEHCGFRFSMTKSCRWLLCCLLGVPGIYVDAHGFESRNVKSHVFEGRQCEFPWF
jgi:hypothetical protein